MILIMHSNDELTLNLQFVSAIWLTNLFDDCITHKGAGKSMLTSFIETLCKPEDC